MSMLQEFKAFAMRGNVVDLAVGVVIGTAFGKIVTALVDSLIMPIVGFMISGVNVKDLKLTLLAADPVSGMPGVTLGYGAFMQSVVDFTIIAFAIFLLVRLMAKAMPKPAAAPEAPKGPTQEELLVQIRDLLKKQR